MARRTCGVVVVGHQDSRHKCPPSSTPAHCAASYRQIVVVGHQDSRHKCPPSSTPAHCAACYRQIVVVGHQDSRHKCPPSSTPAHCAAIAIDKLLLSDIKTHDANVHRVRHPAHCAASYRHIVVVGHQDSRHKCPPSSTPAHCTVSYRQIAMCARMLRTYEQHMATSGVCGHDARLRIDTKGASRQDGAHYDVHQDALYARLFRNVRVPHDVRPRIRSDIYRCLVSCDVVCDTVVASLTNEMLVNMLYECFVLTNAYLSRTYRYLHTSKNNNKHDPNACSSICILS